MNSIDGLRHRDERELGWGMGEAIEASNVEIENNSSLESFKRMLLSFEQLFRKKSNQVISRSSISKIEPDKLFS